MPRYDDTQGAPRRQVPTREEVWSEEVNEFKGKSWVS